MCEQYTIAYVWTTTQDMHFKHVIYAPQIRHDHRYSAHYWHVVANLRLRVSLNYANIDLENGVWSDRRKTIIRSNDGILDPYK